MTGFLIYIQHKSILELGLSEIHCTGLTSPRGTKTKMSGCSKKKSSKSTSYSITELLLSFLFQFLT